MCVAAGNILEKASQPSRLTDGSTLIDVTAFVVIYYKYQPIGSIEGLQLSPQMENMLFNTIAYLPEWRHSFTEVFSSIALDLFRRAAVHDNSKFGPDEFDLYQQAFPNLQKYPYDKPEFKAELAKIEPAVQHHYSVNDHHPEYHKNGVADMHAIQQTEMCCGWLAASERSQKDIYEGLEINRKRFNIDDQLFSVLKNTIVAMKEQGQ
jgi:hypothetical protein